MTWSADSRDSSIFSNVGKSGMESSQKGSCAVGVAVETHPSRTCPGTQTSVGHRLLRHQDEQVVLVHVLLVQVRVLFGREGSATGGPWVSTDRKHCSIALMKHVLPWFSALPVRSFD